MTGSRTHLLLLAFAAAFLVVGIPYWLIPYSDVDLPDAVLTPALLAVFLPAMLLRARGAVSFRSAILFPGGGVPGAVFVRVVAEGIMDPTSHNLWPFEIALSAMVGFACAAPGAFAGWMIARWVNGRGSAP